MSKLDVSSGGVTEVARLDYAVNALGYSAALGRLVGLTSKGHHWWKNPSHVVLIDTKGAVNDLGPVDAHWFRTDDVSAGAVMGTTFYVRDHARLHAIDIDPKSASYLKIVRSVVLDWPALALDDFTPVNGKLTGVSAAGGGPGEVVSFDPVSGRVLSKTEIPLLPGKSTYGAVVIDLAGTVYAVNNGYKNRSRVYRISGGAAVELAQGPEMSMIDGAGCLPTPMPPRVEPPAPRAEVPPPPAPAPAPAPKPTSTPAPAAVPAPVVPPPPVTTTTLPSVPPQPVPVRAARQRPEPRRDLPLEAETTPLTKPRKWAIVTIILVMLGAGAAAARARG